MDRVPSLVVISTPSAATADQRRSPRMDVGLPYTLDGHEGHTRDVSATGLSFESETEYPVGSIVQLIVRYGLDGHNFPFPCEAEVLRVERSGERFNIAARLSRPFFDPAS